MSVVVVLYLFAMCLYCADCADDLETAAVTVYRNPDFFRHLSHFDPHLQHFIDGPSEMFGKIHPTLDEDFFHHPSHKYNDFSVERENQNEDDDSGGGNGESEADGSEDEGSNDDDDSGEEENDVNLENDDEGYDTDPEDADEYRNYDEDDNDDDGPIEGSRYKYPAEPRKPNPLGRPNINIHFDESPDFHHPSRDVPRTKPTKKGRGPYGHPRYNEDENFAEVDEDIRQGNLKRRPNLPCYSEQNNEEVSRDTRSKHEDFTDAGYPVENEFEGNTQQNRLVETKTGTREYLKNRKRHHPQELVYPDHHGSPKKSVHKNKPKTYFAYRIKPSYNKYRVIPFKIRKKKGNKVYFIRPFIYRSSVRSLPSPESSVISGADEGAGTAYTVSSDLDADYQLKRMKY